METEIGKGVHVRTPQLASIIDESMSYLAKAVDLFDGHLDDIQPGGTRVINEFVWNSIRYLQHVFKSFTCYVVSYMQTYVIMCICLHNAALTVSLQYSKCFGTGYMYICIYIHPVCMHVCLLFALIYRWVAYGHQYFTGNKAEAKAWYHKCIAYDTGRPDCQIFLSRIYLEDSKFIIY
jgi:hypothetical protein